MDQKCKSPNCCWPEGPSRFCVPVDGYCSPECKWEHEGTLVEDESGKFRVPKDYRFWSDSGSERAEGSYEDVHAQLPNIEFDVTRCMWKVTFISADSCGYDTAEFVRYYTNVNDILKEMFGEEKWESIITHMQS